MPAGPTPEPPVLPDTYAAVAVLQRWIVDGCPMYNESALRAEFTKAVLALLFDKVQS